MDFALVGRLLAACAVIGVVLAAVRYLGQRVLGIRLATGRQRKLIAILETAYLPNAASVHVIRVAQQHYVIGRSGGHIATLCEIPPESALRWLPGEPTQSAGAGAASARCACRLFQRRP